MKLQSLGALFFVLFGFGACGIDEEERPIDTPVDYYDDACDGDECSSGAPDEDAPSGRKSTTYAGEVIATGQTADSEEANTGEVDDNAVDNNAAENNSAENNSAPGSEFDLQCADNAEICRFCGPPEPVVTECEEGDSRRECQVFELVNQKRQAHGLNELTYNADLAGSAMIHAMDLSMCNYFAHDSLDGTSFFERCADQGYEGTCTGENIGGGQESAQEVFEAWMESPGHRENILYPHHEEMGVAYHEGDGSYGRYWLKHFGRP